MLASCGEKEAQPALLGVEKPAWQRFVMMADDNEVQIHQSASDDSPVLVRDTEDCECDMPEMDDAWSDAPTREGFSRFELTASKGRVLPLLAEEGDWLKVYFVDLDGWSMHEGYVRKSQVKEVRPAPITAELLAQRQEQEPTYTCYNLLAEGPLAGLCFESSYGDYDELCFTLEELVDGCLLEPEPKQSVTLEYPQEGTTAISLEQRESEGNVLCYGPAHQWKRAADSEPTSLLDTHLLSSEQCDSIYQLMKNAEPEWMRVTYYFPDAPEEQRFVVYTVRLKEEQ